MHARVFRALSGTGIAYEYSTVHSGEFFFSLVCSSSVQPTELYMSAMTVASVRLLPFLTLFALYSPRASLPSSLPPSLPLAQKLPPPPTGAPLPPPPRDGFPAHSKSLSLALLNARCLTWRGDHSRGERDQPIGRPTARPPGRPTDIPTDRVTDIRWDGNSPPPACARTSSLASSWTVLYMVRSSLSAMLAPLAVFNACPSSACISASGAYLCRRGGGEGRG